MFIEHQNQKLVLWNIQVFSCTLLNQLCVLSIKKTWFYYLNKEFTSTTYDILVKFFVMLLLYKLQSVEKKIGAFKLLNYRMKFSQEWVLEYKNFLESFKLSVRK